MVASVQIPSSPSNIKSIRRYVASNVESVVKKKFAKTICTCYIPPNGTIVYAAKAQKGGHGLFYATTGIKFTKSFRPHLALGFTQPLTEMSTRGIRNNVSGE
jgi:hypothetical protein